MTAKEFLTRPAWLEQEQLNKAAQIRYLRDMAVHTTGDLTGMPHGSGSVSRLEDTVIALADLERELQEGAERLARTRREVTEVIGALRDPRCRVILQRRHLCGDSIDDIADAIHYSPEYTAKLYRAALKEVEKLLREREAVA